MTRTDGWPRSSWALPTAIGCTTKVASSSAFTDCKELSKYPPPRKAHDSGPTDSMILYNVACVYALRHIARRVFLFTRQ
ncbi:MAG TPA: hypothetical protein VGQ56_02185, partial [Gemmatimonadaceae bacterium]|nr:hypothetical protein [Gemmatimonadaceae bacterium]